MYWPRYLDHISAAAPEPARVTGPGQQCWAVLALLERPRERSRDNAEARPVDHIQTQSALELSVIDVFTNCDVNREFKLKYKQSC